jgi:glutamyl-tRNA reductase
MYLVVVGLNHKTAPVQVREKLNFPADSVPKHLEKIKASSKVIRGCIILSTCNRTEVYAAVLDVDKGQAKIREYLAKCCKTDLSDIKDYLYTYTLYDVIIHLFRVASGLDSMILGETQILGQVRASYQIACEHGATNRVLNTLFQQAVAVGKRVRTETLIDRNAVSISYAAVELAKQIFDDLAGRSVLVIGAAYC